MKIITFIIYYNDLSNHNHDNRYYTETEINNKLDQKYLHIYAVYPNIVPDAINKEYYYQNDILKNKTFVHIEFDKSAGYLGCTLICPTGGQECSTTLNSTDKGNNDWTTVINIKYNAGEGKVTFIVQYKGTSLPFNYLVLNKIYYAVV